MRNIRYDEKLGMELPKEIQIQRILRVMEAELTEIQKLTLTAYYFEGLRPAEIARRRGVHPSTIHRCLKCAEDKLRRHLIY